MESCNDSQRMEMREMYEGRKVLWTRHTPAWIDKCHRGYGFKWWAFPEKRDDARFLLDTLNTPSFQVFRGSRTGGNPPTPSLVHGFAVSMHDTAQTSTHTLEIS